MTCCFCGEEMKMENGAGHSCETTYSPAKTLTDEEIYSLAVENGAWKSKESGNVYPDDLELLGFAKAILRKAQEK
jgi:hypothetical protein